MQVDNSFLFFIISEVNKLPITKHYKHIFLLDYNGLIYKLKKDFRHEKMLLRFLW